MFVVDASGRIVFFNERAEQIMGRSYADVGPADLASFLETIEATDLDGAPLKPADLPIAVALNERRPTHTSLRIARADDQIAIAVTALPLFARTQEFVGAAAIFWVHEGEA